MTTDYTCAIIFTKYTDLVPFFETKYRDAPDDYKKSVGFNQLKQYYARCRHVELILLVRHDNNGHIYCKIKCPVNPLPIRGEFETVSMTQIIEFLEKNGWKIKGKLPMSLLK